MIIRLRVATPGLKAADWAYEGETVVIGRAPECQLAFVEDSEHQVVSAQHAKIDLAVGRVTITDLASTNGTWVNGRLIQQTTPIGVGDEIRLGKSGPRLRVIELGASANAPGEPMYSYAHTMVESLAGPINMPTGAIPTPPAPPPSAARWPSIVAMIVVCAAIFLVAALGAYWLQARLAEPDHDEPPAAKPANDDAKKSGGAPPSATAPVAR